MRERGWFQLGRAIIIQRLRPFITWRHFSRFKLDRPIAIRWPCLVFVARHSSAFKLYRRICIGRLGFQSGRSRAAPGRPRQLFFIYS